MASRMAGWAIARERPAKSAGRKEMGRAATAAWLILRLMGRASSSNSGKSVPSAQPRAGSRPFAPKGRHVCTRSARMSAAGNDSRAQSPRRKRSMIASPVKASDRRRAKGLVSRKVSGASGRSFVSERGAAQAGQVTRQTFRQCFGIAPDAPSRACQSAPYLPCPNSATRTAEAGSAPRRRPQCCVGKGS
jgi:hypothetical protein